MERVELGSREHWTASVTRYQWLVLISSFMGWMFDAMDLNLLTLVLFPSVSQLLHTTDAATVARIGGLIAGVKLFAWGIGGIAFGVVADRFGRARTMAITIVVYSVFTGLSAFAQSWGQLLVLQCLAAVGIGGEWAAGAALVAETWPEHLRGRAMQIMQMAFSFGFFAAAAINLMFSSLGWRWVFAAGLLPVVFTLLIRRYIPEPERWEKVRSEPKAARGSAAPRNTFLEIFKPGLLRVTIVGTLVAMAMMVGSWGGITWIPSWVGQLLGPANAKNAAKASSYAFMLLNLGAVFGYITLMWLLDAVGRRWSYFIFAVGGLLASLYLFTQVTSLDVVYRLMPVYGYFVVGGFGTFAAYLPELYPTRVRATGQGFCWNAGRLLTGVGPLVGGALVATSGSIPRASAIVSVIFVVGMVAIWFGPETKGRPLPD